MQLLSIHFYTLNNKIFIIHVINLIFYCYLCPSIFKDTATNASFITCIISSLHGTIYIYQIFSYLMNLISRYVFIIKELKIMLQITPSHLDPRRFPINVFSWPSVWKMYKSRIFSSQFFKTSFSFQSNFPYVTYFSSVKWLTLKNWNGMKSWLKKTQLKVYEEKSYVINIYYVFATQLGSLGTILFLLHESPVNHIVI